MMFGDQNQIIDLNKRNLAYRSLTSFEYHETCEASEYFEIKCSGFGCFLDTGAPQSWLFQYLTSTRLGQSSKHRFCNIHLWDFGEALPNAKEGLSKCQLNKHGALFLFFLFFLWRIVIIISWLIWSPAFVRSDYHSHYRVCDTFHKLSDIPPF